MAILSFLKRWDSKVYFAGHTFTFILLYIAGVFYSIMSNPAYKYQEEIDNLKLTISCPDGVEAIEGEIDCYRFAFDPIEHELNFLPNIVFDRKRQIPFNYKKASEIRKCSRCAASFFTKIEAAIGVWNSMDEEIRKKLGYTHIALGKLSSDDGAKKKLGEDHFSLYQYVEVELQKKFKIHSPL